MSSALSRLVSILIVVSIIVASASAGYYYYSQTQHSTPSSPPSNSTSTPATQSGSPSTSTSPSSPSSSSTSPSSPPSSSPSTTSTPPPTVPIISMSNLIVSPSEAWPNSPVTISAQLSNVGITGSISLALQINGATIDNRTIQIANGTYMTVQFNATETATGTYNIRLGILTGAFTVVPTGTHTLTVTSAYTGLAFTFDNQTETTPFSIILKVGTYHTIVMPAAANAYTFQRWEDGSTNPTRTITLTEQMSLTAYFSGANGRGSCPSLYVWNGTEYAYASEISDGPGWLGFIDYYNPDGTITFAYSNPWSYIKLDSTQLQQTNGNYRMAITEDSDEIFYLRLCQTSRCRPPVKRRRLLNPRNIPK